MIILKREGNNKDMEAMKHIYHVSNPLNRNNILAEGLIPKIGDSYLAHYGNNNMGPVIFVSLKDIYDSTYDDDRYEIILTEEEFKILDFKIDKEVNDSLYTSNPIPVKNIKLIYKGTGKNIF